MRLTVIICTLSRPRSVDRLLKSIRRQTILPDQIIIVDASENRETEEVVKAADSVLQRQLEYYRTEVGLTRQRNFGIEKATGEVIGFFDDDVVLDNNYISETITVFNEDKDGRIGGTTGYIYSPKTNHSKIHKMINKLRSWISGSKCLAQHYGIKLIPSEPFDDIIPVRYVTGCNMFFRKVVFNQYKFNQWFEGYGLGEDREFGLRVSKQWQIMAVGKARLQHLHEPAGRPNYRKLGRMYVENPARILTVARNDRVLLNALFLIFRQYAGIMLNSFFWLLKGRIRDSINYIIGGSLGVGASLGYLFNYHKNN